MQVIESILADAASIAAVRRDIHAHPELCFEERRTADVIAKQLTDWGIPIHRGMGTTGVVVASPTTRPPRMSNGGGWPAETQRNSPLGRSR